LLCLTHRYYDPATGRFVNRDPIGYNGGINLYAFAAGNPVNEQDPDGTGPPYDNGFRPEEIFTKLPIDKAVAAGGVVSRVGKRSLLGSALRIIGTTGGVFFLVLGDETPVYNEEAFINKHFAQARVKDKPNYPYHRAPRRPKGFRKKVFDANKNREGKVVDPVTKKEISEDSDWDLGHKPGYEYAKHVESAKRRNLTRKQFLKEYQDPKHYRPELPGSNRSRKDQAPNNVNHWPQTVSD
jgi:uncharacterized protein RhaS with RHS repeats